MKKRIFISKKLVQAIKNHRESALRIAVNNDINPSSLSRIINCIETVKPNDERILRLARYLGLNPEDCFEN